MYRVSVVLKFRTICWKGHLGNFYLSFGLQGEKIVLDTDPAKSCEMEFIWLKPTACSPALMLCTESVWFWSSKRFAERAALGNFYLSFGCPWYSSCKTLHRLKPLACSPVLMLCTESVRFWSSLECAERPALGNSYMPLGFKSCNMELIYFQNCSIFCLQAKKDIKQWYQTDIDNVKLLEISQP